MNVIPKTASVAPGFTDPVIDSNRVFRGVLKAMSRPGTIVELSDLPPFPAPVMAAAGAVCLALVDFETPLWLDPAARQSGVADHLRFHCGCPIVEAPAAARYAVVAEPATMPPLDAFDAGSDPYPDRSVTLILQTEGLVADAGLILSGPGIATTARLRADGLPDRLWRDFRDNRVLFPCGVDLVLVDGSRLAALPRTTQVEV